MNGGGGKSLTELLILSTGGQTELSLVWHMQLQHISAPVSTSMNCIIMFMLKTN